MTPVTYQEAANLLGYSLVTINKAVQRGLLSKAPSMNKKQNLIKEQVLLFKGKKQIRMTMLSKQEIDLWSKYKEEAENIHRIPVDVEASINSSSNRVQELLITYNSLSPESKEKMALIGVATAMFGGAVLSPLFLGPLLMGISIGGLLALIRAKLELPKDATEQEVENVVNTVTDINERKKVKDIILANTRKIS